MIKFNNISSEEPYLIFQDWYQAAVDAGQLRVQAIAISSYNPKTELVDSRFVNLKYIEHDRWVFFSNYNGPKAKAFEANKTISALFYWNATDAQIRMRAHIENYLHRNPMLISRLGIQKRMRLLFLQHNRKKLNPTKR